MGNAETLHVGRVQTPTLALLVELEQAIRGFVPEDYLEVVATFGAGLAARLLRRHVGGGAEDEPGGGPGVREGGDCDTSRPSLVSVARDASPMPPAPRAAVTR